MIKRPMRGVILEEPSLVSFPVIASPKCDGIRCVKTNGKALTKTFNLVPNNYVRGWLEKHFPDGADGELMVDGLPFNEISSAIMSEDGEPDFTFYVFDYVKDSLSKPYQKRLEDVQLLVDIPRCKILPHKVINTVEELLKYEDECIEAGYEGVMVRSPNGPYKCGQATLNEGYLLKIKQFDHFEAQIIGFLEQLHNENEAEVNELGLTKRSSAKAGKKPANTLGKFKVKSLADVLHIKVGDELAIGSGKGLTKALRKDVWDNKEKYLGKYIRCKYQLKGAKNKPRFITFDGFRDRKDMSDGT